YANPKVSAAREGGRAACAPEKLPASRPSGQPEAGNLLLQLAAEAGQADAGGGGLLGGGGGLFGDVTDVGHAAVDFLGHRSLLLGGGGDLLAHLLDGGSRLVDLVQRAARLAGRLYRGVGQLAAGVL